MKKFTLLLLTLLSLYGDESLTIFSDNFGDNNRVEGIGFIFKNSADESVKILLKKDNFSKGYSYKGSHEAGEYSQKYLNNIFISAKESQELFIYSPAIKKCEFEFHILDFNPKKGEAKITFSASLVGAKRALKTLEAQEFTIKGKDFQRVIQLLHKANFSINYQKFTNRLRKKLAQEKIKLFRGTITETPKQTNIHFKTNTSFEITLIANKRDTLTHLSISFEKPKKEDKEKLQQIIAATIYVLDLKKEYKGKYIHYAQELLENPPNIFTTYNAQYRLTKENLYEVLPLFNQ